MGVLAPIPLVEWNMQFDFERARREPRAGRQRPARGWFAMPRANSATPAVIGRNVDYRRSGSATCPENSLAVDVAPTLRGPKIVIVGLSEKLLAQ